MLLRLPTESDASLRPLLLTGVKELGLNTDDMKLSLRHILLATFFTMAIAISADKYYCKYCGQSYSSISSLTSTNCPRHPGGSYKGRHAVYEGDQDNTKYLCRYCGQSYSTISSLTSSKCPRHPEGSYKGRHEPYRGSSSASKYYCKYCGQSYSSISSMTSSKCPRHPDGSYKGRHEPAVE